MVNVLGLIDDVIDGKYLIENEKTEIYREQSKKILESHRVENEKPIGVENKPRVNKAENEWSLSNKLALASIIVVQVVGVGTWLFGGGVLYQKLRELFSPNQETQQEKPKESERKTN